jgi:hypothetical protein
VKLLHVKDNNPSVARQQVWQDFCRHKDAREKIPVQQSLRKKQWTFDGELAYHLKCTMERLVLDLVDDAIRMSEGTDDENESVSNSLENRIYPFVRHFGPERNAKNENNHGPEATRAEDESDLSS